jgi:hypothetical protein
MLRALLATVVLCGTAVADDTWPALAGSGFLTLPDARTAEPRRLRLSLGLDNRDRDPLGLDVFDYSVNATLGLPHRLELSGSYVFSRVVAMPEPPALPPPPVDVVLLEGAAAPARPWYSLYSGAPYVNKRGTARFGYFVPGNLSLGLKRRLLEGDGRRPSLAGLVTLSVPVTKDVADLQSGSGTGGADAGIGGVAEWSHGARAAALALQYTHVGAPALADRVIRRGAAASWSAGDEPLELPDRLDLGIGVRQPLGQRWAAVLEAATSFEVGGATEVLDRARPLDVLLGAQARLGRFRTTLGLRYHGNALPSGAERTSSLGGSFVDLTGVPEAAARSYLESLGASGAFPHLRPRAQRLIARPAAGGPPLPEGARLIPLSFRIRSEHQLGFVIGVGVVF